MNHGCTAFTTRSRCFVTLAIGDERALLYDTAYGLAPLHDVIRELTSKPYDVILSHGHIDHVNGAFQFDEVWLHEGDLGIVVSKKTLGFN